MGGGDNVAFAAFYSVFETAVTQHPCRLFYGKFVCSCIIRCVNGIRYTHNAVIVAIFFYERGIGKRTFSADAVFNVYRNDFRAVFFRGRKKQRQQSHGIAPAGNRRGNYLCVAEIFPEIDNHISILTEAEEKFKLY